MRIERDIIKTFKQWKDDPDRKPILLKGARQIGKTWAMETFGKECFDYCVKFDFDRQAELKSVFETTKSPDRLVKELALYCEQPIVAGKTLMIFDEIQECEAALNSLKYFCEDAPQYHIIAAGSLLGVAVRRHRMTVPVGKVKVIKMFPVTFKEFLRASDPSTYGWIENLEDICHLPTIILNKLNSEYRRYQVSGGMPDAIVALLDNKGVNYQGQAGAHARSIFDGEVTAVFQLGALKNVLVRHGSYISVYCNLSSTIVARGQKVKARDILGTVAQDDRGNYILHFQLRKETAKLNPEVWIGR